MDERAVTCCCVRVSPRFFGRTNVRRIYGEGATGVSPGKMKGLMEERRWKKDRDKVMLWSFSSHGEREGEAPRAWLVEGATQVPVIDRGKP